MAGVNWLQAGTTGAVASHPPEGWPRLVLCMEAGLQETVYTCEGTGTSMSLFPPCSVGWSRSRWGKRVHLLTGRDVKNTDSRKGKKLRPLCNQSGKDQCLLLSQSLEQLEDKLRCIKNFKSENQFQLGSIESGSRKELQGVAGNESLAGAEGK